MRFNTSKFVKYCLWIFNIIFLFCGLALITIGVLVLSKISHLKKIPEFDFLDLKLIPSIVLILGCFMCMVALIGFCGATRQNICCLTMYSFIMFAVFCIQLALIVYIYLERDDIRDKFDEKIEHIWERKLKLKTIDKTAFSLVEAEFGCCGYEGFFKDYIESSKFPFMYKVPSSCCGKLDNSFCTPAIYRQRISCKTFAKTFWSKYLCKILYVGIAVAVVEFIAFIFGCCLAANIRKLGIHY